MEDRYEWHQEYVDWLDAEAAKGRRGLPHDFCTYRDWLWRYKQIPIDQLPGC